MTGRLSVAPDVERFLYMIWLSGEVRELRAPKTTQGTISGYYDNVSALSHGAAKLSGRAPGVYMTINPVKPELLARSSNRFKSYADFAASDADILSRQFILIDIDPVRPSGISSTDAEQHLSFELADLIETYLISQGCPSDSFIEISTGNGAAFWLRVNLPNDKDSTALIKRFLESLDFQFSDRSAHIDTSVHNAARIAKIPGTMACKGDNTIERPHRVSAILKSPDVLSTCPTAVIEAIAARLPVRPLKSPENNHKIDVAEWLAEHCIQVKRSKEWNGARVFEIPCQWNPEHNRGEAFVIQFDNGAISAGCHHNSCQGNTWADLRELKEPGYQSRRNEHHETVMGAEDDLPEIVVTGRHLRDISADALCALYTANNPSHIFRRSGELTRIGMDEKWRPFNEPLTESALRGVLARAANFVRKTEKGDVRAVAPPLDVTRDIKSLGRWEVPQLVGITESPVLRCDGTVITVPGHDAVTGLFYTPAPGLIMPPIPDNPTRGELKEAVELITEVLIDFPFDSEASHANAIGALISLVLRHAIEGPVPLPIIDKPQAGTGASLIADVNSIIATGHLAATMGMPQSEEEWEKKLSSHLLAGRSLCVIDNIERKLNSSTLSRYLTSTEVSIRPLGRSADIILPSNMTFIATGNNIKLGGDMPRRCYWIRLDAGVARPWMREIKFKHPSLREWVFENRGAILAAILTLARGWITAGRPTPENLPVLGGFEGYCRTIGAILAFMGIPGFLSNLMAMYEQMDADTPQWEAFLATWHDVIGETPVTVAELINKSNDCDELAAVLPDSLSTMDGRDYSRRIGNALAKRNEMRLPNGLMVAKAGERKRALTWAVVSYKNANSPLSTFKSELGELANTPRYGKNITNLYKKGAGINSLNSPVDTKMGELSSINSPNDPDYCNLSE